MKWLTDNYDRVILLVVAAALIGSSAIVLMNANGFANSSEFSEIKPVVEGTAPKNNKIDPLDTTPLTDAMASLEKPRLWDASNPKQVALFKSAAYIVKLNAEGQEQLVAVDIEGTLHEPITNAWVEKYHLQLLDDQLKTRDPDADGFNNLEEFTAGTDPTDKNSSPPLVMKLRMKSYVEIPFRLIFKTRMGDTMQLDTLDLQQPTLFLQVGDMIPKTPFKILELIKKEEKHPTLEMMEDASEVVVENTITKQRLTLPRGKAVNNPDSYVVLTLIIDDSLYQLKKDQQFSLKPEPSVTYQVISISPQKTVIINPQTKEQFDVPPL